MTDETGGKPRSFDKMHAGLLEALEYAKTDPMTQVTIPTAALTELIAAAEECASDLACHVNTITTENDRRLYDSERRRHETDMAPVRRLRAAVARVKGKAPMTMREKMARAMHAADLGGEWPVNDPAMMDAYLGHADAALSALAEPTEAMLRAGSEKLAIQNVWSAMIGAAGEG